MAETPDDQRFPSSPLERTAIAAKTGLKVGGNYAKYLARRAVSNQPKEEARKALHDRNAKDIFKELTRLRGTALKFAQGISLDPGIIPAEFVDVMSQAQYSVPPMKPHLVVRQIRQALGDSPAVLFDQFDATAIAAASIGQVHRARLKDGRVVAVKVQYPNIRATIKADLGILRGIAARVVKGSVDPYIDEIRDMMLRETDYGAEGRNIEFFAAQYGTGDIVTPRWIPELSATSVLTMTFVEGQHLHALMKGHPSQDERNRFGQLLFDFSATQIASGNRTIHADFHPGNFLFQDSGRLGVLDFGAVKTFPEPFIRDFLLVFRAHLDRDEARLRELYTRLDILSPTQKPKLRKRLFEFFLEMGELIVSPYRSERFNFGDPAFLGSIRRVGMEAMEFRERQVIGSPHFVFVNRVIFGLLSILSRMQAEVETASSLSTIQATIDLFEARAA
jgi:predicted unusual protein kinase regulating ubiquinone biosynthesis (AarF/ABC1/UbiB family)